MGLGLGVGVVEVMLDRPPNPPPADRESPSKRPKKIGQIRQ